MTLCIPYGFGVPVPNNAGGYDYSGSPEWWDTAGPISALNTSLEDPRWVGSSALGFSETPSVITDQAQFRAVYSSENGVTYLLLSWLVKVDPNVGDPIDAVRVGFANGTEGFGFQIYPGTSAASVAAAQPAVRHFFMATKSAGTWGAWSPQPIPSWLDDTRVWIDPVTHPRYPWAVQMRVRTSSVPGASAGLKLLPGPFRFRFQVDVIYPTVPVIHYKWPRTASTILGNSFGDPDSADWDNADIAVGGTCPVGVSIEAGDVGTTNPDGLQILYAPTDGPPKPINTFFVKPRNAGAQIPASTSGPGGQVALSARFRIANWGSTPTNGLGQWVDIPEGGDVRNTPDPVRNVTGVIPSGGTGDMQFHWTVEDPWLTDFRNGTRRSHQCILVELSGPGLLFTRSSLFQNMSVVHASNFTREAEISVKGLASIGTPHRTVYLYVQTLNMPTSLSPPSQRPTRTGGDGQLPLAVTPALGQGVAAGVHIDAAGNADGESPPPLPPGPPPPRWQEETRPVYIVHAWHTTGETETGSDGVTRDVVEPQTSYGLYVEHSGPLFGWDHKLTGPGLVEIAPDFYRVSVPNNGSVAVTTSIESLEVPNDFGSLLAWLWALLKALLRLILRWPLRIWKAIRKLFGK
jgi:hypothetical protein